ncbi:hypothetical protein [Bradyrhizobium sp. DASA03007]|uniref:hypothetical protein n=1 Tax=unclassified Bradyrhizobium TaxID=2631580 RepID=UPI003F716F29
MDVTRIKDVFDPSKVNGLCTVVGAGATGSAMVNELTQSLMLKNVEVWDEDKVEDTNLGAQPYTIGSDRTFFHHRS